MFQWYASVAEATDELYATYFFLIVIFAKRIFNAFIYLRQISQTPTQATASSIATDNAMAEAMAQAIS
jgi:hypothetical protein